MSINTISQGLLLGLSCLLLTFSACRPDDTEVIRINPTTFDAADEAAIGRRLTNESWRNENVTRITPDNGEFTDAAFFYLRPLLQGLLEQPYVTRRDSFDWQIHLVLDITPHAYTLPGGQIIVHTGLLHQLENEAECVGILAREVALAEIGAPMAAFDRQVEDNVTIGDMILGNIVPLDHIIEKLPAITYNEAEMATADSIAAKLVCQSDYEERGLTLSVKRLSERSPYATARPANRHWLTTFDSRISECPGADSLYRKRYKDVLEGFIPR
ncbi:MAG: M48 family metalloprotease [Saprospiraceae bacterium]